MINTVQRLLYHGLSEGTRRLHKSAFTLFEQYLQCRYASVRRVTNLPIVDVNIVINFVAFCFDHGLTHSTIKQYLSGIKHSYVVKDMVANFPGGLKPVLQDPNLTLSFCTGLSPPVTLCY